MLRERVSENVYWFQSEIYAQVTAGAIIGPQWSVVIDSLAIPEETIQMRTYIEDELSVPVRYIINTHYHADHTWGNCYFPGATIIAHQKCRNYLIEKGQKALDEARKQNQAFRQIKLVLPHITFGEGQICLRVGKKNLIIMTTPGHSADGISVLVEEDRIFFAGDTFIPVPHILDGDINEMAASIKMISKLGLENIIQGHGDIILRGEIDTAIKENLAYLQAIKKLVRNASRRRNPLELLASSSIESSGKNRVYLGGLAEEIHQRNLRVLYHHFSRGEQLSNDDENRHKEEI